MKGCGMWDQDVCADCGLVTPTNCCCSNEHPIFWHVVETLGNKNTKPHRTPITGETGDLESAVVVCQIETTGY